MDQRSPSSFCQRHANLWQVCSGSTCDLSLSVRAAPGPHGPLKRSASLSHCDWAANKKTGKRVTCLDSLTTTLYPAISVSSSPALALSIPHSVTLSICGFGLHRSLSLGAAQVMLAQMKQNGLFSLSRITLASLA